jgi:UDP-glucose:(heptosyl)LPS alpha-1,3-glucosyltransferase
MTWDLLEHLAACRSVAFVGSRAPDGLPKNVSFIAARPSALAPRALEPLEFRRRAARALRTWSPGVTISLGAITPATDVVWVHSVHRAWLRIGRQVPYGRITAPARLRYAMPRHLVLLAMEWEYFTRSRARKIICTSHREADDLAELYGVDPALMTVLPDPFDPGQFNIGRRVRHRAEARARMGLEDGEIALLFVANELHRKGFAQALGALAKLDDHRVTLHLVGRTPPTAYAATIERLGLSGRVAYHGATSDVGWWYAGGDLLLLPTQYEPFGLVVIEALASGLPVITTRLAGAAAAVQHGTTGFILDDPYSVSELASLISSALDANLDEWSRTAAGSVDGYRRDRVMPEVERILFPDG